MTGVADFLLVVAIQAVTKSALRCMSGTIRSCFSRECQMPVWAGRGGASPFPKDWDPEGMEYKNSSSELECRAYSEQKICAQRLRDGGLGGAGVDKAYSQAVRERRERKCGAFGY